MAVTYMEIRRNERPAQHKLDLDKASRDALADLCRQRWPAATAKLAAREWDLTVDEARGVVAGRCSFTTYDKILKRGGLSVALPLVEAVTGQSIAHFFREMRKAHAEHGERLAALFSDPGAGSGVRDHGRPGGAGLASDLADDAARRVGRR